jgi:hypothetical protein
VETPILPSINSDEGYRIVRNWLACGAPVIENTDSAVGPLPGTSCTTGSTLGHAGVCVYRIVQPPVPPEQNWASIYNDVIYPFCGAACHGDGTPNFVEESGLDLSSQQLAYDSLVNQDAKGEDCEGEGTLIIPGDGQGSLFVQKMSPDPTCGDPMPTGATRIPEEVLAVIRAWIDSGAPND